MIRIENLSKDLGEFFLRDVSLEINDGEYFMVLGPTGAGKTILLETIAGIYRADSGRIFLDEQDITDIPPRERNIGMVYQDYTLFPFLTVEENIGFGLKSRKIASIVDAGTILRIAVDVGIDIPFVVAITKQSFDEMNLKTGGEVYITFKASAVHVF